MDYVSTENHLIDWDSLKMVIDWESARFVSERPASIEMTGANK